MEVEYFLEHHGIKGQRWGIRRDPKTGVRPVARTFSKSSFGRAARTNAIRKQSTASKKLNSVLRKVGQANQSRKAARTPEEQRKHERNVKIAKNSAKAAAGAIFIAAFLASASRGGRSTSNLKTSAHTASSAADLIRHEHATQLYSLTRMHTEGKMDAEQFANFKRILDLRYDRKLFEAGH